MTRLLAHLLAADLRRHRVLVAFWLLVAASTANPGWRAAALAIDPALRGWLHCSEACYGWRNCCCGSSCVGAVVQTHPLVGSDAFWTTRPIPPRSLLASKLALLGVATVVAPAFARAVLMAAYGVPAALLGKDRGRDRPLPDLLAGGPHGRGLAHVQPDAVGPAVWRSARRARGDGRSNGGDHVRESR